MKWGIRRYQPYPKGKHGTFLGQDRDDDIRIKAGTKAYRLQNEKDLKPGQSYVSFDRLDNFQYLGVTAYGEGGLHIEGIYGDNGYQDAGHVVTMELTKDVIAPSYDKTMDAFIDTLSTMSKKDVNETFGKANEERAKQFLKDVKHMNVDECRDKAYEAFTSTFMRDTKAKKMFFDNLKAQGYNAIIDENDKHFGKEGFTEAPTILFDAPSTVKVKSSQKVSGENWSYFADLFSGDIANAQYHNEKAANKLKKELGTKEFERVMKSFYSDYDRKATDEMVRKAKERNKK